MTQRKEAGSPKVPPRAKAKGRTGGRGRAPSLALGDRPASRWGPCPHCGAVLERTEWLEACAVCDMGLCKRCNEWGALDVDFHGQEGPNHESFNRLCSEGCALAALRRFIQSAPSGGELVLMLGGIRGVMVLLGPPHKDRLRFIIFRRLRPEDRAKAGGRKAPPGGGGEPRLLDMTGFIGKVRKQIRASGRPYQESMCNCWPGGHETKDRGPPPHHHRARALPGAAPKE